MTIDFRRHSRNSEDHSGYFKFMLTNTQFGHEGIKGYTHFVPIHQAGFLNVPVTAAPTAAYGFDGTDGRTPLRVTGEALASEMHSFLRFQLPDDFGTFHPTNALEISTYRNDDLTTLLDATFINGLGNEDPTLAAVTILPSVSATWERFAIATPTGTYARGGFVTLRIKGGIDALGGSSKYELADVTVRYVSGLGNVLYT